LYGINDQYASKTLRFNQQDVGFVFRPEYQNQGYGTEAATAFLNYFIHDFGLKNICAMVQLPNDRSVNLVRKLGFEDGGDAILEPWGAISVFVLPEMKHLSKETTTVSQWGVEK
jgi:RimJ/RimL family protein N-acetyltransferase